MYNPITRFWFGFITFGGTLRNKSFNKEVDEWFREALKNPTITEIGVCTCKINGETVWISNRYYGGPSLYDGGAPDGYCSTQTARDVYRLVDSVQKKKLQKSNDEWFSRNSKDKRIPAPPSPRIVNEDSIDNDDFLKLTGFSEGTKSSKPIADTVIEL